MAFYYVTEDLVVYKSAGARKIKRLFKYNSKTQRIVIDYQGRHLQANWTQNIAQDLQSLHGIDVEAEMAMYMTQEIAAEFDMSLADAIKQFTIYHQRNKIPIQKFKCGRKIICQSKHFYDVVTELLMHELEN